MAKPHPSASARSDHEALLDEIIAEVSERIRGGESIDIEQYVDKHPNLVTQLRQLYPAMQAMANLGFEPDATLSPAAPNAPEDAKQLGTLGDFRLLREIGRGGMGVVYEAHQLSLSRNVALKVLPFAAMLDDRHIQRFKNEALAAAQLDHPHIVDVYGVGCERSVHYYAMRYVEGTTLAEVIRELHAKQPLAISASDGSRRQSNQHEQPEQNGTQADEPAPESRAQASIDTGALAAITTNLSTDSRRFIQAAARIGIEVAEALDHAHEQGITHRDIKPGNILLDNNTKTWVTDFGLARIEANASLTMTGDLLGTMRYMSPEQAMAKRVIVDHRTDIYSLGVTLYELVTLQPAFPGNDRQELMRKIAFEEPPLPRKLNRAIPEELETIILKASAKNPAERYATAADLAEDLRCFLDNKPIQARRPNLLQRLSKWSQRHRAAVFTSGLVASLLLCFGVVLLAISNWMVSQERDAKDAALAASLQNLETSERQQRRAEENLELAISALDNVYVQAVGTDRLLGPDDAWRAKRPLTPKEERLLATGLEFYGQLVLGNADSHVALHRHAKAYERIAELHVSLGNLDLARKAYQSAIEHLTQLTQDAPSNAKYFSDLGSAYFNMTQMTASEAEEDAVHDLAFYRPALDAFQAGLEIDPDNIEILSRRSMAYRDINEIQLAFRDVTRSLELAPNNALFHRQLAVILLDTGGREAFAEAQRHAETAVQLEPDNALGHVRLANTLVRNHDSASARKQIEIAIQLDPSLPNSHIHLAKILREAEQFEEALKSVEKAIEVSPNSGFALFIRGLIFRDMGERQRAVDDMTRAVAQVPGNPEYRKGRAEVYAELGEFQKALSDCDTVGRLGRRHHSLWHNQFRTSMLVQLERWEEAAEQITDWIASKPANSWAFNKRAVIHFRLGNYDEGIADLGTFLDLQPSPPRLNALVLKLLVAGDDESIRKHFLALSKSDLDASERPEVVRCLRAQLFHASKSYQELDNECTHLIEVNPQGHYYFYLRAGAQSNLGKDGLALEDLNRAVDLLPDDETEIRSAYKYFQTRGELLIHLGEPDRAVADFSTVLEHHPDYIHDVKRRSWAYFRAGDFDHAIADLREAVHKRPDDHSNLTWISPAAIADCPDAEFRAQYVKLADEMVRLNDSSSGALSTRATILASFGEFEQALADLEAVIAKEDATYYQHYQRALLVLAIDDPAKYREACGLMLKTFSETKTVRELAFTAWTCVLAADSLTDYSAAIALAKRATEKDPRSLLAHRALAGLLMRANDNELALDTLQQVKSLGEAERESSAYTDYLLAIAHHRLGESASAQAALDEANAAAELELADADRAAAWNRRLTLKLLREDAETLIDGHDAATRNEGDTKKTQN